MCSKQALAVLTILLVISGCDKEKIEANEVTCNAENYKTQISKISDDVQKKVFEAECKSFITAKKVREWEFVPSEEDDF